MSKVDTPYHKRPDYSVLIDQLYELRATVDSDYKSLLKTKKR
jgi:hypothetical protein